MYVGFNDFKSFSSILITTLDFSANSQNKVSLKISLSLVQGNVLMIGRAKAGSERNLVFRVLSAFKIAGRAKKPLDKASKMIMTMMMIPVIVVKVKVRLMFEVIYS